MLLPAAFGAFVSLFVFFGSAKPPSPFVADGLICCGHPDTWLSAVGGVAFAAFLVGASFAVGLIGLAAIQWSSVGRWPRLRLLVGVPAVTAAVVPVLATLLIVPKLGQARVPPDCDAFVLDRRVGQLAGRDPDFAPAFSVREHQLAQLGIAHCDALVGRSLREVRALLGPGDWTNRYEWDRRTGFTDYGLLHVSFEDNRVTTASIQAPVDSFD